jgi:signal transduction histidine kinase
MFDNLIENAMKYSDKTSPIHILLKDFILTIEDKGIGIEEKSLASIFKRYYQYNNKQQGKGIGLALVKDYCDKEKIKIALSSKVDKGTIVKLNLSK